MPDLDYPKLIKEQELELSGLHTRMDDDRKLLYLNKYELQDANKKKVKDVIHVTLNKPAVFASNVISALNSTRQQIAVDSDDTKVKTAEIEVFLGAAFAAANQMSITSGDPVLDFFTDTQACIRGRVCRRVLFRIENGVLITDITSWDTRFVTGEVDKDGKGWRAYKSYRSRRDIEADYGKVIEGKYEWVSDVWDDEHNEVWVGNERIKLNKDGTPRTEEHGWGFCPVVHQIVPLGYGNILMDNDRIQYEGESIFFLIRDLIPQLNMWLSILQTLNLKTVKGPMKQKLENGGEPSEYEDATGIGTITSMKPTEDIARIDYGDAIRATQLAYQAIEKGLQEGSYTDIDIGNVKQPFSAVALITIGESKDQVYLPRLATREALNKITADMLIKQTIMEAKREGMTEVEVGTPGHKKSFKIADLEGEYEITFRSFLKSPKTDIARIAMADQAKTWYPRIYTYEHILQVEDSKGLQRQWYSEVAEKLSPNVLRNRVIMNLLEMAEDGDENAAVEAQIMAAEIGATIDQIKQGIIPPPPAPSGNGEKPTEPLIPLLGKGGQVGGIPRVAIGSASPEEEGIE